MYAIRSYYGVEKQGAELVAPVAEQQVDLTDAAVQQLADLREGAAPDQVPVGVVDLLEVIQVDEDHRKFGPVTFATPYLLVEGALQETVVVEAGQVVGVV